MSSCCIPSASLLRHLTSLTRRPITPRRVTYCEHQRRCLSRSERCSAKRSDSARSPRAQKAAQEIGTSWASAHYRKGDWHHTDESLKTFADVLTSKWVEKDFAKLGLRYRVDSPTPPAFVTTTFLGTMKNGRSPVGVAEWFSGRRDEGMHNGGKNFLESLSDDKKYESVLPLADPRIMGQALYILGYQFIMSTQKVQRDLGEFMLKVAVLMHNRGATMAVLVSNYRRKSAGEPAPQAYSTLKSLANQGNDIGAMCLRAEMLMWPNTLNTIPTAAQRSQAYNLALDAFEKSEPGPPISPPPPTRVAGPVSCVPDVPTLPPWLLLQRMADSDGRRSHAETSSVCKQAVEAGTREYDDPSACELATSPSSSIVPVGSADWIKFATKAAMAGKGNAARLLGQYYLELHGWYPAKISSRKRDKVGFQWMEVSLSQTTFPLEIRMNAFLMALLLRENGDINAGMRWLEVGAERVDEVARMKDADTEACAEAMDFFDSCHKDWHLPLSELPPDWKVENCYFPERLLPEDAAKE